MHINIPLLDRIIKRNSPGWLLANTTIAIITTEDCCQNEAKFGVGEVDPVMESVFEAPSRSPGEFVEFIAVP